MSFLYLLQGLRVPALLRGKLTAGRKPAARLGVDRRGDFPFQQDPIPLHVHLWNRDRGEQRLVYG